MEQYRHLISNLESGQKGTPGSLPASTVTKLSPYFHDFPLRSLRFISTTSLSNGCFSDCEKIYCADEQTIDAWTRQQEPVLSRLLLHQITHAQRCEREGGRERFVSRWFSYLPEAVWRDLQHGKPIDAEQIHYAMYMERMAENRAENLCMAIPSCRFKRPAQLPAP